MSTKKTTKPEVAPVVSVVIGAHQNHVTGNENKISIHHNYYPGMPVWSSNSMPRPEMDIAVASILQHVSFTLAINYTILAALRFNGSYAMARLPFEPDQHILRIVAEPEPGLRNIVRKLKVVSHQSIAAQCVRKAGGRVSEWDAMSVHASKALDNPIVEDLVKQILIHALNTSVTYNPGVSGAAVVTEELALLAETPVKELLGSVLATRMTFDTPRGSEASSWATLLRWNSITGHVEILPPAFSLGAYNIPLCINVQALT